MDELQQLDYKDLLGPLAELSDCALCPRDCHVDRINGKAGYCKADASFSISSICIHQGEEPAISGDKGICNIFFTNCNLQCIYCQNFQISSNKYDYQSCKLELQEVLRQIIRILSKGINIVGFVSPSHFIPQVKVIVNSLRELGYDPTFVYNTNAFDKVESLKSLEPFIDVYLPDLKYSDNTISKKYSDAGDYPEVAKEALKEMFRQVGSGLAIDGNGYATSGLLIRHLVLPGHVENSKDVLRFIARELSPDTHISLMSQYYPTHHVSSHPVLGRTLRYREYKAVVDELESLGFSNGWVQHLDSHENYRPDFMNENPFQENNE